MGAKMRCLACDANLTDFEATRKSSITGQYIDLCNGCFSTIKDQVYTIERPDLEHDEFSHGEIEGLDKDSDL
jgi:hypothetical protein